MSQRDGNSLPPQEEQWEMVTRKKRNSRILPPTSSLRPPGPRAPSVKSLGGAKDSKGLLRSAVTNHAAASTLQASTHGALPSPGGTGYVDPSNAPRRGPAAIHSQRQRTVSTSECTSDSSNDQYNDPNNDPEMTPKQSVCVMGPYFKKNFRFGDIISVAHHRTNLDPNIAATDRQLTFTTEGPVYSKRRLFVVMFMCHREMLCLPIFTFNKSGLHGKGNHTKLEYVCIKNVGDKNFGNQGYHKPVEAECKEDSWRLDPNSTVGLACSHVVSYKEDIAIIGRMPRQSYYDLRNLWNDGNERALNEKWHDD